MYCLQFLSYPSLSFQSPSDKNQSPSDSQLPPSYPSPPDRMFSIPEEMAEGLKKIRLKDDLSGWIYSQIQWVAKAPSSRAGLLKMAQTEAWRNPRTDEERQAWLDLLINEGYALLLGGDIVHSTDAYTAAFQWAKQYREMVDESQVLENILKPLGNNYTRLGDYEQALFIHRKALSIAAALGDKTALAGTYSNLANTTSNMGLPGQSLDYCRQGLAVAGTHSAFRGLLLSEQADACRQLQRTAEARKSILASLSELERARAMDGLDKKVTAESGYWLMTAYQQAGDIFLQQPTVALEFYKKALLLQNTLLKQQGVIRRRQQAKLCQRLGDLYFHMGQIPLASGWLNKCLSVLIPGKHFDSIREPDLYAENTLVDLLFTRASLCQQEDSVDKALILYKWCFSTEKKLRNELITGSSKEKSVSDSRMRYEAAIGAAWNAWEGTRSDKYRQVMLEFMESSKSRLLLEDIRQQQYQTAIDPSDTLTGRIKLLERALIYYQKEALQAGSGDSTKALRSIQEKQVAWDLAALQKKARAIGAVPERGQGKVPGSLGPSGTEDLDLSVTSSILTKKQIIRSFFAGSTALYVVELWQGGIRFAERLVLPRLWQDSIRNFMHTYFEEGPNSMINQPRAYYTQAYRIYRQFFGGHPFSPENEYILIPDGTLSQLPVEALVTEPVYQLSPEKWPFVIKQTQISYAWSLRTLQEQIQNPGNKNGFAGFFISGNTRHLPLLQAIARERESVARSMGKGNWFTDEQATTDAFRTALRESAIVHISSHAFSRKDTLDLPHIELYNEPYYVFESKGMEHHPSLIVLSACRTGDGRLVTGEGAQSLARAFTASGAGAVIAGSWNLHDEAAARLMGEFYKSLVSTQYAAGALRDAKLNWLNDPQIPYLHKLPYYWAALHYQGNPEPLGGNFRSEDGGGKGILRIPFLWWKITILLFVIVTPLYLLTRSYLLKQSYQLKRSYLLKRKNRN
ncbi:CHAT domain-containing protein [Flavitalea flava]